ncbi:MAG TPA: glycosyltransferase [Nitrososphaeraceae archaeon]|nr:glycosyltransferase [Nitrososphaeraceae archaeon]
MKSDKLWIAIFFSLMTVWLFVLISILRLSNTNVLVDREVDLSIPTSLALNFNMLYLFTSIFVFSVFLVAFNKLQRYQRKIKTKNQSYLKQQDLCSIIIPARNEENVIKRTVIACLEQTYRNIEILVICHNSTDGTFEQVKVEDDRVRAFNLNTKETGKAIALNYAVEKARGKYILVVDADGIISRDFIENSLPLLDEPYVAVQGRCVPSNRNYNFVTKMLALEDDLWFAPFCTARTIFGNRCPLAGTGFIILRDILIKAGMFSNNLVDDYELTYRLLRKRYSIAYAPLSIIYDEKPPTIELMLRQRARWAKGFQSLIKKRIATPRDILGNIYWLNPIGILAGLVMFLVTAYASIHNLLFDYFPYTFSYLPLNMWYIFTGITLILYILVIIKQHGKKGIKYIAYIPLYIIFSQYSLVITLRGFFVKSWGATKTTHGFTVKEDKKSLEVENIK